MLVDMMYWFTSNLPDIKPALLRWILCLLWLVVTMILWTVIQICLNIVFLIIDGVPSKSDLKVVISVYIEFTKYARAAMRGIRYVPNI